MEIIHLLYADDPLIFWDATVDKIYLMLILSIFDGVSCLHLKLGKILLYSINDTVNIYLLAVSLGCEIGSLWTTYLVLPLEAMNKAQEMEWGAKKMWEEIGLVEESVQISGRKVDLGQKYAFLSPHLHVSFTSTSNLKRIYSLEGTLYGEERQ